MALAARIFPNGIIRVAANGVDRARLSRLLYMKADGTRCWATYWTYATDLRREFGKALQFRDGSAEVLRALIEDVKNATTGDDAEINSWFSSEFLPRPFQREAIHFGLNRERVCIADSVGLGKTPTAWGIALGALTRGHIRRVLLIVPASLRLQWFREIQKFSNPDHLPQDVRLLSGDGRKRAIAYRGSWQVAILSPEAVLRDQETIARLSSSIGMVILDEASILRNGGKTAQVLTELFRRTRYRIALTATPIENSLHDLYNVARWVDRRTFLSRKYFDKRYVIWKRQYFTVVSKKFKTNFTKKNVVPSRYINLDEVRAKLKPILIRRTAKDVAVQLPAVTFSREIIELPKAQREVYDRLADKTRKEIEGLEGIDLEAPLAFLRQACDTTELVEEGGGLKVSGKLDRLKELLSGEFKGESVLIFTSYARMVNILMRELRAHKPAAFTGDMSQVERRVSVDRFTRGYSKLLIGTNAAERGLNLQVSGLLVNFDIPWSPAAIKQRIGRLRRIGSTFANIRVYDLIAEDTVEEKLILPKLVTKHRLFEDVLGEDELSRSSEENVSEAYVWKGMNGRDVARLL